MLFKSILTSLFLLVPVVLANPTAEHRQPQLLQRSADVVYNSAIAGAAFEASSVDHVAAVFTIPHITGQDGTSATVLATIDGFDDCDDLFASGVQMLIDNNGPFYQAVYKDEPGGLYHQFGPRLFAGDEVQVTVGANQDRKTGYAQLTNRKTKQSWKVNLSSSSTLCMRYGGWLIEKVGIPLPNFGTVTLKGTGDGIGKHYTPSGSTTLDIKGQTETSISGNDVIIRYL